MYLAYQKALGRSDAGPVFTTQDTASCIAQQIIDAFGIGPGDDRNHGASEGLMNFWVGIVSYLRAAGY